MDTEELKRIKKGNPKQLERLQRDFLHRGWFLCYHLTQDTETAAPLLITAWVKTLNRLAQTKNTPKEGFLELLATEIYYQYHKGVKPDDNFSDCPPPQVHAGYRIFTDAFEKIDEEKRTPYLLYTFGGLSTAKLAVQMHLSAGRVKELVQDASSQVMEHAKARRKNSTEVIGLSTKFRSTDGSGLAGIEVPDFVYESLEHELSQAEEIDEPERATPSEAMKSASASKATAATAKSASKSAKGNSSTSTKKPAVKSTANQSATNQHTTRKEPRPMSRQGVSQKKRVVKIRKRIITIAVICIIVAAGGFGLWRYSLRNNVSAEIVTTYYAEAITYGDVDSTISGSGTLTPVTNEVLSTENPCTVDEVNVAVGDTVKEGDVIAVVTQTVSTSVIDETTMEMSEETEEEEVEITAPCDGLVTELPVAEGDSLEAGGEIAIVLGTETGFTVSLSVDETEIANVAIGQEATVTVDAVDGEYTGEVTNLSYNGSSNGSTTAYQLTVTIDYEEGTEYDEDELDLDDLTQVTVTTDMSDDSYIMIESDELAEGDLIIMSEVTTTATTSDDDDDSGFGGGFGGGGGGMDFGDMDFSNMDFSNMPQMGEQ
ncbi:MAG: HlyD family secretion protein [Ruminococcus sp.]|nr:HlyD family secretion protein [Ruminococcus sp.]